LLSLAPWQAEPSVKSNPFCVPDKIYEAVPIVSPADAIEFDQPASKYDFWWLHRFVEFCENCRKIFNNAKTSRGRGDKLRRFDGIAIALP
jgi:hypothetical protein